MNSNQKTDETVNTKGIVVKILTYNAFIRPPFVSSLKRDYRDERLALFGEKIFNIYDIVAFQEMFSILSSRIENIIELAKKYGLLYHWRTPKNPLWKLTSDGGLLLLSRYPIVDFDIHQLIRGIHGDFLSDKSVIYAKIEVLPKRYLHIFSSHVQASYSDYPHVDKSKSVRIRFTQLTEIRNFIQDKTENVKKSEPIFLLGDLNVNSRLYEKNSTVSSKEYKIMMDILCGKRSFYHPSTDLCNFCFGWCSDRCQVKRIKCYPDEDDELNNTFEVYDMGRYFFKCHPNTSCKIFSKKYYKENDITQIKKSLDYVLLFNKIENLYQNTNTNQLNPEMIMSNSSLESSNTLNSSKNDFYTINDNSNVDIKDNNSDDDDNGNDGDDEYSSTDNISSNSSINDFYSDIPKKKLSSSSNMQSLKYSNRRSLHSTTKINRLKIKIENSLNRKSSQLVQDHLHTISKYYKIRNLKVEKFKIDDKPYQYLSDHYGISFCVEINN